MMTHPLTLSELVDLIHAADKKQSGCTVNLMSLTTPENKKGALYAVVHLGWGEDDIPCFSQVELQRTLKRAAK
jgi:hypothetical protein